MREVAVQIETLPPPMQEKSYKLMNRTVVNLQDKLGFILASGVSWETILRLIQAELRAFREEGIDPLSESVARELFFVAASKVFPDLPLDEWNRNVESLSDRTRKLWWESQMKMDDLLPPSSSYPSSTLEGPPSLPSAMRLRSPSSLYSSYSSSNRTLAAAATGNDLKRWLESLEAALILAGVGIVDDSGKTPTAALREVGENLERLKQQSEDLLLLIEDEIRYIAKGGKPETSIKHLGESVKRYASEYTRLVPEEWRKSLNLPPASPLPPPPYKKREEIVHEIIEIDEEELEAMVGDEEGDWF
ncbi:hypothetical protein Naga_100234g1 [Nannochloropsis gaditana]|uniref:Uncharacterized protein n=1 Tax=Nannochloropsis gaditana TaxID=72520 RepID=W7TCT4_9STRA|nr:hypothetical protein Naga_100234g1 [Nannochloropsis gaditana]